MTAALPTRTSDSHPLHIATLTSNRFGGRIGLSFCPGKVQPLGSSGAWARDLAQDLDVIRDAGYAAVVTLIEQHEIDALGVTALGSQARARHMDWLHLPIRDVSIPDAAFDARWRDVGEGLRARLRDGFSVFVHCKGGLGRAGTIAARLLIELGTPASDAIAMVRAARPGAIETQTQEAYVRALSTVPERVPSRSAEACEDRAIGALVGLCVGDALGTTLEFSQRDSAPLLTDMIGGGPFRLKPGQWTDDSAMALALADSLLADATLDPRDLMQRFVRWHRIGAYSCTGACFDIGITTRNALARFEQTGDAYAGSLNPSTAGNGSLMRLAPVAIRHAHDRVQLRDVTIRQSRTTHAAPNAIAACAAYADMLADAIEGLPRSHVLRDRTLGDTPDIDRILAGSWRGRPRSRVQSSGYVAHSLEAALWCVGRTSDFASAVLAAANLGDDADTTAAITGQLAGALYGVGNIPKTWLNRLSWRDHIVETAKILRAVNRQRSQHHISAT